jgi:1,2-dihydroxy-3-keto-5-methylthiopentene dioxygenase
MRAYYYDHTPGDFRLPHDSGRNVTAEQLAKLNVLLWHVPIVADEAVWRSNVAEIAKENDFTKNDWITVTKEGLGDDYEKEIQGFFDESVKNEEFIGFLHCLRSVILKASS